MNIYWSELNIVVESFIKYEKIRSIREFSQITFALGVGSRVSMGRDVLQDVPGQTQTVRPVVPLS